MVYYTTSLGYFVLQPCLNQGRVVGVAHRQTAKKQELWTSWQLSPSKGLQLLCLECSHLKCKTNRWFGFLFFLFELPQSTHQQATKKTLRPAKYHYYRIISLLQDTVTTKLVVLSLISQFSPLTLEETFGWGKDDKIGKIWPFSMNNGQSPRWYLQLSFLARNFQIKSAKRSRKVEKLSRLTQRIISWLLPDETSHVVFLLACDWLLQLSLQPL